MRLFTLSAKVLDGLSKAAAIIGAALIVPLIGALTYEVFSRYVLLEPTFWAYEMSYMLMGSAFLLGMAYTLQKREHVNVDILYSKLSPRGRALLDLVCFSILLVALGWMTVAVFNYAVDAYQFGERSGASGWNPIIWPFRAMWVLGFFLLGLQTVVEIGRSIQALIPGQHSGGQHE